MPGDAESAAAHLGIERLRREHLPKAFEGVPVAPRVGGAAARLVDFFALTRAWTPWVIGTVLALSFVLLTVAFRSVVVPLKAIVLNLLSVAAAYGAMVLVFQQGHGASVLGVQQVPSIEAWIPLFLFTVLYGLSMDYHVMLLSRMREHYAATRDTAAAVSHGLSTTARVITGAAAIIGARLQFEVPMEAFAGHAVQPHVEGRPAEAVRYRGEQRVQRFDQRVEVGAQEVVVAARRQQPRLVRQLRRLGRDHGVLGAAVHEAAVRGGVRQRRAPRTLRERLRLLQFELQARRQGVQAEHLAVVVRDRRAGERADVLEQVGAGDPGPRFQCRDALLPQAHAVAPAGEVEIAGLLVVQAALGDHFVVGVRRILVRERARRPARLVRCGARIALRRDLGRRVGFLTLAERTGVGARRRSGVHRPLLPQRRHQDRPRRGRVDDRARWFVVRRQVHLPIRSNASWQSLQCWRRPVR
jgi:hypothetical protein